MTTEEMQAPVPALKAEVPIHQVREVAAVQEALPEATGVTSLKPSARNRGSAIDLEITFSAEKLEETPLEVAVDALVAAPPVETPAEIAVEAPAPAPAPVEALVGVPAPATVKVLPPAPVEAPVEIPIEMPVEAPVESVKAATEPAPVAEEAKPIATPAVPAPAPNGITPNGSPLSGTTPPKKIDGSVAVAGDKDQWLYHKFFENDLIGIPGLTPQAREEVITTAWEYSRIIIPQYSNWERFSCWVRFMVIGILAEYEGSVLDIALGDKMLGYDVEELLNTMLRDRPDAELMKRDYRAFLLISADKCCSRRDGDLFRRYVNHIARGPQTWFRARDCDALVRFTIVAAFCSNDIDDISFTDEQWDILGEIGVSLYDAVAFFKHRAEGEIHSTFSYVNPKHRADTYKRTREILWAFDAAWGLSPKLLMAVNFLRPFGGPLHMMMRRYRYIEDGMIIGVAEDEKTVEQTRRNYKLWHRVDRREDFDPQEERCRAVLAQKDRLLYLGLAEELEKDVQSCDKCVYRKTYGTINFNEFGGVKLCEDCQDKWIRFSETLPERAVKAFPELLTHSQYKVKK